MPSREQSYPWVVQMGLRLRRAVMAAQAVARRAGPDGRRYWPPPRPANLLALAASELVLRQVQSGGAYSDVAFLQIGANDGVTGDPIRAFVTRYGWHGVCLEPQPEAFARLQATYRDQPQV